MLISTKLLQEECDSKLHRVLQGIRKTSEVDFKFGESAPELQTCGSDMFSSSFTGKKNCAPELTPLPELVSHRVPLTVCTSDGSVNEQQSPGSMEPGHHLKKGRKDSYSHIWYGQHFTYSLTFTLK